jgi:large subunit ribosomal protein L13
VSEEESVKAGGIKNRRVTQAFGPETTTRRWYVVDASGQTVGRLATRIASVLRGKHKPEFSPSSDAGDFVVVVNAEKVLFRGNDKVSKKIYYKHTGWMGHVRQRTAKEMLDRSAHKVIELAVSGMLPRGALGNSAMKKLKIYAGAEHPHRAQAPEVLPLVEVQRKAS